MTCCEDNTLIGTFSKLLQCDPFKLGDRIYTQFDRETILHFMKGRKVRINYRRKYINYSFNGLSFFSAKKQHAYNGLYGITVQQHYYARHRIHLSHIHLPCAMIFNQSGRKDFFPLELLTLVPTHEEKEEERRVHQSIKNSKAHENVEEKEEREEEAEVHREHFEAINTTVFTQSDFNLQSKLKGEERPRKVKTEEEEWKAKEDGYGYMSGNWRSTICRPCIDTLLQPHQQETQEKKNTKKKTMKAKKNFGAVGMEWRQRNNTTTTHDTIKPIPLNRISFSTSTNVTLPGAFDSSTSFSSDSATRTPNEFKLFDKNLYPEWYQRLLEENGGSLTKEQDAELAKNHCEMMKARGWSMYPRTKEEKPKGDEEEDAELVKRHCETWKALGWLMPAEEKWDEETAKELYTKLSEIKFPGEWKYFDKKDYPDWLKRWLIEERTRKGEEIGDGQLSKEEEEMWVKAYKWATPGPVQRDTFMDKIDEEDIEMLDKLFPDVRNPPPARLTTSTSSSFTPTSNSYYYDTDGLHLASSSLYFHNQ